MEITRTAYGTWNGGRFLPMGEGLDEARFVEVIQYAYKQGVRTFLTADVFGNGEADVLLGKALKGIPRNSYALVGLIGHDFYKGQRHGGTPYPRFTDPTLRGTSEYPDYIRMATEKSLERCGVTYFDCLLLQNPDFTGFGSDAVWKGMSRLMDQKLAMALGIAPGPMNGFVVDLLLSFERFGSLIDWAMLTLNPLESWPGRLCLAAAEHHNVKVLTRGVDHSGLFYGDIRSPQDLRSGDSRLGRPEGWMEVGQGQLDRMRPIAERHGLTMLQLAGLWNLSHLPVESVAPTLVQEISFGAKSMEAKIEELAGLPVGMLTPEEVAEIAGIGENRGGFSLKGGSPEHVGAALADGWILNAELLSVAKRWGVDPEVDLVWLRESPV